MRLISARGGFVWGALVALCAATVVLRWQRAVRQDLLGAECWNPRSGRFERVSPSPLRRKDHTATLLTDGTVLVAGGTTGWLYDSPATASAEVYDPSSGRWHSVGSMHEPHTRHRATRLGDGSVLVIGGMRQVREEGTPEAELFDPVTKSWTAMPGLDCTSSQADIVTLADGRGLLTGCGPGALLFDPRTRRAEAVATPLAGVRAGKGADAAPVDAVASRLVALPDGRAVVLSHVGTAYLLRVFDPTSRTWSTASRPALDPVDYQLAPLVHAGRAALVAATFTSVQRWDLRAGAVAVLARGNFDSAAAVVLADDRVALLGGGTSGTYLDRVWVYDPASGATGTAGSLRDARLAHTATLLRDGRVLVVGGDGWVLAPAARRELWIGSAVLSLGVLASLVASGTRRPARAEVGRFARGATLGAALIATLTLAAVLLRVLAPGLAAPH